MKLTQEQLKEILSQRNTGHPSREIQHRIEKLERIVLNLAKVIDDLSFSIKDIENDK